MTAEWVGMCAVCMCVFLLCVSWEEGGGWGGYLAMLVLSCGREQMLLNKKDVLDLSRLRQVIVCAGFV